MLGLIIRKSARADRERFRKREKIVAASKVATLLKCVQSGIGTRDGFWRQ